jgi:hypothetical protein
LLLVVGWLRLLFILHCPVGLPCTTAVNVVRCGQRWDDTAVAPARGTVTRPLPQTPRFIRCWLTDGLLRLVCGHCIYTDVYMRLPPERWLVGLVTDTAALWLVATYVYVRLQFYVSTLCVLPGYSRYLCCCSFGFVALRCPVVGRCALLFTLPLQVLV